MAYVSKEKKAKIFAALKEALKDVNLKWSLAVDHYTSIVFTAREGDIDFAADYQPRYCRMKEDEIAALKKSMFQGHQLNCHHFSDHFTGRSLEVLNLIIPCLNIDNHNNSDLMTDYHDVGHYVDLNIGRWNKPYILKPTA